MKKESLSSEKLLPGLRKREFAQALIRPQAEKENRACEDAIVFAEDEDVLVAGVLDGASALSSVTKVQGGELELGGQFAARQGKEGIKKHFSTETSAKNILLAANEHIAHKLRSMDIDLGVVPPRDLSRAYATLVRIDKREAMLDITQLGDTIGLIEFVDGTVELALPRTGGRYDRDALELALKIAHEEGKSLAQAAKDPRVGNLLARSVDEVNQPDGSGCGMLCGKSGLERYIYSIQVPLFKVRKVVLLSDGMALPTKGIGADPDWKTMMSIINANGLDGLYEEVLRLKNSDPELTRYPRFKKHDDASGIVIDVERMLAEAQRRYFQALSFQHVSEMRLLIRGGKLWSKDPDLIGSEKGWRNPVGHQLTALAVAYILGENLQLPPDDFAKVKTVAAVHDWNKRMEATPEDFTEQEKERAEVLLQKVNPDPILMQATGKELVDKVIRDEKVSFLEMLLFYIDGICEGGEIVPIRQRAARTKQRRTDIPDEEYWEVKLPRVIEQAEQAVFNALHRQGVRLDSPKDIPNFVRDELCCKIAQYI